MKLAFTKMQGAGNDFVVIDATRQPFAADPAALARLADRRFGIGCDQIAVVDPSKDSGIDFGYRIYNADGSESGMSGNGARCVGRFIREQGLSEKERLRLKTKTSTIELHVARDGATRVNMGEPRFEPSTLPFTAPARSPRYSVALEGGEMLEIGAASMGNPHAVIEVADVDRAPVGEIGEALQHHPAFPERVNVGFLQVQDRSHVRLRVYERGAGETLACGSGACAAIAVARMWGQVDARVDVQVRGGVLIVEWQGEGSPLFLGGPAETVFEGEMEWPKEKPR
ncbi:MAG TPA: diaminopimelate epimerase [Nevskiaceae bacterium]|nr:diaminopimelate epimerase [Nevskiaceae bacterium]